MRIGTRIKVLMMVLLYHVLSNLNAQKNASLESVKEEYRKRIIEAMKKNHVVGVSLIVLDSNSIVWQDSFGFADKSKSIKVDEHTQFGIGSVTKVFTATAALKAQEQSLWNIDDPLKNYISYSPKSGDVERVTIRSVLYHHSGLPSDVFAGMFNESPVDYRTTLSSLNEEHMSGVPGQVRAYSNPAFSLIGYGIEKISGKSYQEYVKQSILMPLGMHQSHFNCLSSELSKTYNKEGEEVSDACLRDVPAGGMYSSISDLRKWANTLLHEDEQLLSHAGFREMFSAQNQQAALDFGNSYGLGWSLNEKPYVGKYWSHTGTTLNYNASLIVAIEAGLAIIILTNSQNGDRIYSMGSSILRDVAKAKGQNHQVSEPYKLEGDKKIEMDRSVLTGFEGTYIQPGLIIPIKRKGDKLYARVMGFKTTLIPVSANAFVPKVWLLGIIPIRLGDTRFYFDTVDGYSLITQRDGSGSKEMLGVRTIQQPKQGWDKVAGRYVATNLVSGEVPIMESLEVKEMNNIVVLSISMRGVKRRMTMPLEIQSPTLAKIGGLGRYAGTAVELVESNEAETSIKVFGITLKKSSK